MIEHCDDNDECFSVNAVCHFELAAELTEELIKQGCKISCLDIHDYKYMGYIYEFVVSLLKDEIIVEPAYKYSKDGYRSDGYVGLGGNVVYVHEDCNSKLLKFIDTHEVYEFGIENANGNSDNDIVTCHRSKYETVCKNKNGVPTGFTKTWSASNESGISSTSTYSFYSNNLEELKAVAKAFDIKI